MITIKISGKITVETGMHIGGSDSYSAIGAIDNPVIKDALTGKPYIPGSSLKGKLRSIMATYVYDKFGEPKDDGDRICSLFGSMGKSAKLKFNDAFLSESSPKTEITEVKTEVAIDRSTGRAKNGALRQMERVIKGTIFDFEIFYSVKSDVEKDEIIDDIAYLYQAIRILEIDYLGGSGTRGYGRVSFMLDDPSVLIGDFDVACLKVFSDTTLSFEQA